MTETMIDPILTEWMEAVERQFYGKEVCEDGRGYDIYEAVRDASFAVLSTSSAEQLKRLLNWLDVNFAEILYGYHGAIVDDGNAWGVLSLTGTALKGPVFQISRIAVGLANELPKLLHRAYPERWLTLKEEGLKRRANYR
jgi:hypothetical protein